VAPGGRNCYGSLEFTGINGIAPIDSLLPGQALRFEDLDFIADHMGQLRLKEGNAAPSYISMLDHGPARVGPAIVDSDALACKIGAYLGANLKPELSRHIFYVLANAFA
jgi:hypothetical protein